MTFRITSGREKPVIDCGPGLTEQHHKKDCDIHHIMKRFEETGILNHVAQYEGQYANFLDAPNYQEAQNLIAEANSMFETVPAKIRAKFANDPGQYVSFMTDPANIAEIEALGLDAEHLKPLAESVQQLEPSGEPVQENEPPPEK